MKVKALLQKYKDIVFFLILYFALIMSVIYGQLMENNIGQFDYVNFFGGDIPLYLIILIPIVLTFIYVYLLLVAIKNKLIKFTKKDKLLIGSILILTLYEVLLISLKDNSHLYNDLYPHRLWIYLGTLTDRVLAILSFYLSMWMTFSFYFLIKSTKNVKKCINIHLIIIVVGVVLSIIYSLFTEFDLYINFIKEGGFINKEYSDDVWIKSFYGKGNIFGHTCYIALISMMFLSLTTKKKYLGFLSLVFVPFIIFSGCRSSVISTLIFYLVYLFLLAIPLFKKHRKLSYIYLGSILILFVLFLLETFVFKIIKVNSGEKTYTILDVFIALKDEWVAMREWIIIDTYKNATPIDYIFGLGYGLNFVSTRTQGWVYYFHNTFVEIFSIGGVFYSLFVVILFVFAFYKTFKLLKKEPLLFLIFVSLFISQIFYGFFESMPILFLDFFGFGFSVFFLVIPNVYYEIDKGEDIKIKTLSLLGNAH